MENIDVNGVKTQKYFKFEEIYQRS